MEVNLPESMQTCVQNFGRFYDKEKASAKLTWVNSLGSCTVKYVVGKKKYDLEVATLQAAALACFNDQETLTYQELLTRLNITPEVLKPTLHSLCCGKQKVIAKSPASR